MGVTFFFFFSFTYRVTHLKSIFSWKESSVGSGGCGGGGGGGGTSACRRVCLSKGETFVCLYIRLSVCLFFFPF